MQWFPAAFMMHASGAAHAAGPGTHVMPCCTVTTWLAVAHAYVGVGPVHAPTTHDCIGGQLPTEHVEPPASGIGITPVSIIGVSACVWQS